MLTLPEKLDREKTFWLKKNRGLVSQVAAEMGVKRQWATDVFWERKSSRENRIELRLIELGAPGFKDLRQQMAGVK